MYSEKDICNQALFILGQYSDVVSMGENSAHTMMAMSCYPLVRDVMLERHDWNFATVRVKVAPMAEKPIGGEFAYPLPADCVKISNMYSDLLFAPYIGVWNIEQVNGTECVVTDTKKAVLVYVKREENVARYSAHFKEALIYKLASRLAGPIIRGDTGIKIATDLEKLAQFYEGKAVLFDAKQKRSTYDLEDSELLTGEDNA